MQYVPTIRSLCLNNLNMAYKNGFYYQNLVFYAEYSWESIASAGRINSRLWNDMYNINIISGQVSKQWPVVRDYIFNIILI